MNKTLKRIKFAVLVAMTTIITCTMTVYAETNLSTEETIKTGVTENKIWKVESKQIKTNLDLFHTNEILNRVEIEKSEETKVEDVKVKVKKTMTVSSKQKIKITEVLPKAADNKDIEVVNKTKSVLKVKNNKITAKKAGTGKIVIQSDDGAYEDVIKIKVKKKTLKCDGVKLKYRKRYNITSKPLTSSMGVKYYNGHRETYYSQKVLPGGGLKIPGRHVADDGTIRDKDGYIVVAANYKFRAKGSTFITSLGPAKVYDTGCAYGTVDIYCNW